MVQAETHHLSTLVCRRIDFLYVHTHTHTLLLYAILSQLCMKMETIYLIHFNFKGVKFSIFYYLHTSLSIISCSLAGPSVPLIFV